MDRIKAAQVHADLQIVLKNFAEKHGLICAGANTKFDGSSIRTGIIQFGDKGANPAGDEVDPRFLSDLKRNGYFLGLKESMIGKAFTIRDAKHIFIGMRASKIVLKEVSTGKLLLWRDTVAPQLVTQFAAM